MATKTKAELMEEIKTKNQEIANLKGEVEKLDRYKKYEEMADEIAAICNAFVNAGLSEQQAYDMTKTMITIAANPFMNLR